MSRLKVSSQAGIMKTGGKWQGSCACLLASERRGRWPMMANNTYGLYLEACVHCKDVRILEFWVQSDPDGGFWFIRTAMQSRICSLSASTAVYRRVNRQSRAISLYRHLATYSNNVFIALWGINSNRKSSRGHSVNPHSLSTPTP